MSDRQVKPYKIKVNTQKKATEKEFVSVRSMEGQKIAYCTLSNNALRIYLMITAHSNTYSFTMGSETFNGKEWPFVISRSTYSRAIKELKDNGYLIKRDNSQIWDFYDYPQLQDETINVVVNKRK